jgi:hypothetical protein
MCSPPGFHWLRVRRRRGHPYSVPGRTSAPVCGDNGRRLAVRRRRGGMAVTMAREWPAVEASSREQLPNSEVKVAIAPRAGAGRMPLMFWVRVLWHIFPPLGLISGSPETARHSQTFTYSSARRSRRQAISSRSSIQSAPHAHTRHVQGLGDLCRPPTPKTLRTGSAPARCTSRCSGCSCAPTRVSWPSAASL